MASRPSRSPESPAGAKRPSRELSAADTSDGHAADRSRKRPRRDANQDGHDTDGRGFSRSLSPASDRDAHETAEQSLEHAKQQHSATARADVCAEAGVLESVTLVDFMNHEHLTIDLGSNMNFIIGNNGSGKSAILTAITTCLGGKASISGRGSSLKGLVRQGQPQATISIRLKNKGPDAFKPEVYGHTIIIERRIQAAGGGSYVIKDYLRQKKSTKKEDLEAITDHFGLAIENPMNVLSQDTARQFLANATPKILYDLFMKGIELQQLEADHNLLAEFIGTTDVTLVQRARDLDKLRDQEAEASRMYEESSRARDAHVELDILKDKMAWIQVRDVETIRNQIAARLSEEEQNVQTVTERLVANDEEGKQTREDMDAVNDQMRRMKDEQEQPILDRLQALRAELRQSQQDFQRLQTEVRECHTQIKRQDTAIESTMKAVADEKKSLAENEAGIMRKRLQDRKAELESALDHSHGEIEGLDAQYTDINSEISTKQNQIQEAKQNTVAANRVVEMQMDRLTAIQNASRDTLSAFHPNMEAILRQIDDFDRQAKWQEKPVGPLGKYMKLKYREWSDIVETFWGKNINGFLVSNHNDKKLLLRLLREKNVQGCPVFQGTDREFQPDEPDERYLTVLRAIEWSNERVRRQLIVTNRPEGQLLIRSRHEAELTMDPLNPPRHAMRAFAIDPEDPSRGFAIGGGARGSSNQNTTQPYRRSKRLTVNSIEDLEECRTRLESAKEAHRSAREIERLLEQNLATLNSRRSSIQSRRGDTMRLQQIHQKELAKLVEDMEVAQTDNDGKLKGLEEALRSAEMQKEIYCSQYRDILAAKTQALEGQNALKRAVVEVEQELDDFKAKLLACQPRLLELTSTLQTISAAKAHYNRQYDERKKKVSEYEKRLKAAQTTLDEHIAQASQICERVAVEDGETVQRLERKLQDKVNSIRRIELRYGGATVAQITARLTEARENLRITSAQVNEMKSLVEELRSAHEVRQKGRKVFLKYICVRAKNNFVRHLGERDFLGRLSFDHKAKELHTHVTPADVTANMKGKGKKKSSDNKVLSGGEKSFTTICLLLSIWEAMGCPIRALDEFDVFMDSVNRGISMRMMIESANDSVDKQFIIITPLDMGGVQPTTTTKIHRLRDPRAGIAQAIASQG